jgi:hypothetical protein
MPNYSSQYDTLLASVPEEAPILPMLVWSDTGDRSEVFLVSSPTKIRQISHFKSGNIIGLLDKIADLTKQRDPVASAYAGDELLYPLDLVELDPVAPDWTTLIADLRAVLETRRDYPADLKAEVLDELENDFRQDVTAAALEAVYNSIIYYLAHLATELGVRSLGFVGELAYNDRFRTNLIKNLNEEYQLRFAA